MKRKLVASIMLSVGLLWLSACSEGSTGVIGPSESQQAAIGFAGALGLTSGETLDEAIVSLANSSSADFVARCMKGEGFEWLANPDTGSRVGRVGDPDGTLSDEEYAETYGFGIDAMFSDSGPGLPNPADSDPNRDYLESLSEQEREIWFDTSTRCTRDAYSNEDQIFKAFDPFAEAAITVQELIDADPNVIGAQQAWSACMADDGHPGLQTPQQLLRELLDERSRLAGDEQKVEAFARREVAVAVASRQCSNDLDTVVAAVRGAIEDELLAADPRLQDAAERISALSGS